MDKEKIISEIELRLREKHIGFFKGHKKPLFLISETYPGVWLEHVYDSVFYAMQDRSMLYLAENTTELFLSLQKEDGQLPYCVIDGNRRPEAKTKEDLVGYWQIQECVSFARLCYMIYEMNGSREFLSRTYSALTKWAYWLKANRMTRGLGLIEMFVGFDTGHDRSGRLHGMGCVGNNTIDGVRQNAAVLPPEDGVTPIIAVDMSCNYYGTLTTLAKMARELGLAEDGEKWLSEAREVKEKLFEICFDKDDCFFYDVDKNGNKRKYLSSTIFHLFLEDVLDKEEDTELIRELYERHIGNPEEFATPYPYPSMAISDPSCKEHAKNNCWGYYSQGLIALRCTLWMDEYGFSEDFDRLCRAWVKAWGEHYDTLKFGQELDPISGTPTDCSEWYSSTMLFYLYAAKRLERKGETE